MTEKIAWLQFLRFAYVFRNMSVALNSRLTLILRAGPLKWLKYLRVCRSCSTTDRACSQGVFEVQIRRKWRIQPRRLAIIRKCLEFRHATRGRDHHKCSPDTVQQEDDIDTRRSTIRDSRKLRYSAQELDRGLVIPT